MDKKELKRFFPEVGDIVGTCREEREGLIVEISSSGRTPPIIYYNIMWLDDFNCPLKWIQRKEFRIYKLKK